MTSKGIEVLQDTIDEVKHDKFRADYGKRKGVTIGVHAGASKGKTLTTTMLTVYYLLNRDDLKGVISNYKLDLTPIGMQDKYRPLKDIKMLKESEYKNFIILTDEFRRYIDSRMSSSFKNMFISNILADTGKYSQIHMFTDQDGNSIDRRIRVNTDVILVPRMLDNDYVQVKIFKKYGQYYTIRNFDKMDEYPFEFYFKGSDYYKFYDTEEKIDDYFITYEPDEHYVMLDAWLEETKYKYHPDFSITNGLLKLWKKTQGVQIMGDEIQALMEWIKYNTELPMRTRARKPKD